MSFKAWMLVNESQYPGYVGLWWVDGEQFYLNSHEVEDGKNVEGSIHSVTNHQRAWESTVVNHRPDLKKFSYTYLPRGRIYYDTKTSGFTAVGTPSLLELPKFLDALGKKFHLKTEPKVSTGANDHYTGDMGPDPQVLLATIKAWK